MTPEISVVIPTLGRSAALPEVRERLEAQRDAPRFEVVVVADAAAPPSTPATLRAERAGASAARNAGLREARGPIVLFLGDDVLASPRLLATHAEWHARLGDERVGVLGHVRWAKRLRRTAFMAWLERGIQTNYGSIEGDRAGWGHFYTTNVSVKRAFALRAGGFDEDLPFLYEDLDLGRRLHDLGLDLRYVREAEGEHLHPATLDEWRRRMEAVGAAERAYAEKHPGFEPYFLQRLGRSAAGRPARGRGARLAALIPPGTPFLGPRVWASAEAYFAQQLWPAFRRGYDRS